MLSLFYSQQIDWAEIPGFFKEKCLIKNIEFKGINSLFTEKGMHQVNKEWKSKLGSHLNPQILPDVNQVITELKNWLGELLQ